MKCNFLTLLGCSCVLALSTHAGAVQNNVPNTGNGPDNPDWLEETVEAPPAFSTKHLIPIDMPAYVTTKTSLDPDTLVVGADGVVRYVMVMTNASGNINAVFEGLRCVTNEVKTYARFGTSGQWSMVQNPVWKDVTGNLPSKHALAFARQAACINYISSSKAEVLTALKAAQKPGLGRFTPGY